MFIVTNREIRPKRSGVDILGKKPNAKGPNELRVVEAVRKAGKWRLEVLPDEMSAAMKKEIGASDEEDHITDYVAHKLLSSVNPRAIDPKSKRKGKNLLVFVHGFNNDIEDVLERSRQLSRNYGVEVLAFSWPANGGGPISGTASYKSDKRDAKASIGAFDRTLAAIGDKLDKVSKQRLERVREKAAEKHPTNPELRDELIARTYDQGCPFTVNLLAHSMGNYLYKHLLLSTASEGKGMLFDNVVLCAADTNNLDHARWVDEIRCRRRVYVTINEDDKALQVSRMKSGDEQLARLGHYPFNLYAKYAAYVQFTDATSVGRSHAYFEGDPLKNAKVKRFFKRALNGERVDGRGDRDLTYEPASNTYRL